MRAASQLPPRLARALGRRLLPPRPLTTASHPDQPPIRPAPARALIPPSIWSKTTARLHLRQHHPLSILRAHIEAHFHSAHPRLFSVHSALSPIVTPEQCFDDLLVPPHHPSRAASDTYYLEHESTLLRPHMTAHTPSLLSAGESAFLLCGDVYRRDTVDHTHYPVFHQLDAARLFPPRTSRELVEQDLKRTLSGLADALFGDVPHRWVDGYFPFTHPSFEMEVLWQGRWLELLGCGLLHRGVLRKAGVSDDVDGWAFGMGLERVAMVLFGVPDIRLFWAEDERFLKQFRGKGVESRFQPYSVYPAVEKDVSFWVGDRDNFHENDVHEVVRAVCGDLAEDVNVVDRFERDGKESLCFRIRFRSMTRSLTHAEINQLYAELRDRLADTLPVTLR